MGNWCSSPANSPPAEPASKDSSPETKSEAVSLSSTVSSSSSSYASSSAAALVAAPAAKPKIDPKSLMCFNLKDQVVFRPPGSICGYEFIIDGCTNCDIYVCDQTAQVTVDGCTNCRFFFAPCESSIFIRDCTKSQVVAACQQLRLRNCTEMEFLLFCGTQPVIESSNQLRFGCFQFAYFSLLEQFQRANLSVWTNEWSRIYDFTANGNAQHWSFLDESVTASQLLPLSFSLASGGTLEEDEVWPKARSPVPLTAGTRPLRLAGQNEACFVLVAGNAAADTALQLLDSIQPKLEFLPRQLVLHRTRQLHLSSDQINRLAADSQDAKHLADAAAKGMCIGLEFAGESVHAALRKVVGRQQGTPTPSLIVAGADAERAANMFFEEFKPVVF